MSDVVIHASYKSAVDKTQIPTCNILGVEVAAVNMKWLLEYIRCNLKKLSGDYITVANVHTTVTAFENTAYREVQNGGIMAIPDGGPLSTLGRKRGYTNMTRIAGPDLMDEIFKVSADRGYRHYFYGATPETLDKLHQNLTRRYPGIFIAGMYSPPFRDNSKEEDATDINRINDVFPNFLWVGLGAPKQELWMAAHQGKVNSLMIGVGAGFDYHAEKISRAPMWFQNRNLEWVFRLMQDPIRLFGRYWRTNTRFIWNAYIKRR